MDRDIAAEYELRRGAFAGQYDRSNSKTQTLLLGVLTAAFALAFTTYRLVYGASSAWWLLVSAGAAAVLLSLWQRERRVTLRAMRLLDLYERALARVNGVEVQSGHTGEAFWPEDHLYARDLDVLGPTSLFAMLATTRTAVGQKALADFLLHFADAETIEARQAAVQQLAPLLDLRERVALLGWSAYEEVPAESFARWLALPELSGQGVLQPQGALRPWMRWPLLAVTTAAIALIAVTLLRHGDLIEMTRNVAALLAVQGAFTLWLRPQVVAELEAAQRLPGQTAILRDGLRLLNGETFNAPLLLRLQKEAEGEEEALRSLDRSLTLVDQRAKEWYYAPALALAVGTHAAISLSAWRRNHGVAMRRWVAAWAEFEALLAVANYAVEHPGNVYPEISKDDAALFKAESLAHPLLLRGQAIANDVQLDAGTRFLLVSGSNMAGKSTLLRSVGCNVVLAATGAPVCARSARTTALRPAAALALVDSLAEGKSKFLAEVERLRDLVALAKAHPASVLFLIDEIFSGTNSADRRVAAEAVLRNLIAEGAIGALSTHDLALAELGDMPELHGHNVHMASPDESDPLAFDYLLKDGVNRTTNALAIVRLLGLN